MNVQLISYTHLSELEDVFPTSDWKQLLPHLSYTFAIEKISRACSHQLVRHRVASFSQQSQRYITIKRLKERVVVPPSVNSNELFYAIMNQMSETYQKLVEQRVPKEDARFVLPNATETSLLMTMDGKSLMHFIGLRTCNRAQWEIRKLADMMLKQLRDIEPRIFNNTGPYCYQLGYCPEGRHSCGKIIEVKERYQV